jgi:hypothetical protein
MNRVDAGDNAIMVPKFNLSRIINNIAPPGKAVPPKNNEYAYAYNG